MSASINPDIVTDGLVLCLDAGNSSSYPGTGTSWYDLSGNGYNFTIDPSAYSGSGIKHMNFEGSYGIAKRIVNNTLTDVPNFSDATILTFSSLKNSTADWRTLTRGASADHHVLIQNGTNVLGMYDNDGFGGFRPITSPTSFDVNTIPDYITKFNYLVWRLSSSSIQYRFQYNNNQTTYTINSTFAAFNNGFCCIGGAHNGAVSVTDSIQYWGKIAVFFYYNRQLSSTEISQNYNAIKGRYGL